MCGGPGGAAGHEREADAESVLAAAVEALMKAEEHRAQIGAGLESEPGQDISAARAAIIDFACQSNLADRAAGLIAAQERENA